MNVPSPQNTQQQQQQQQQQQPAPQPNNKNFNYPQKQAGNNNNHKPSQSNKKQNQKNQNNNNKSQNHKLQNSKQTHQSQNSPHHARREYVPNDESNIHDIHGPRFTMNKEWMLPEDIEAIINVQEVQLHSDNPFLEDYYFQNFMKKRNPNLVSVDVIYRHRPICECFLPAGTLKQHPSGSLLGRSFGTFRAPRQLVELKTTTVEEKSSEGNLVEDIDGGGFARALIARTAGLSSLNRTLLITIETAFSDVLEIEDLNLLISASATDSRFNHQSVDLRMGQPSQFHNWLSSG